MTLRLLASESTLGVSLALLPGTAPLFAMAVSSVLLRRRYSWLAWAGACLLLLGMASLVPFPSVGLPTLVWSVWAFCVPGAAMISKEVFLKEARGPSGLLSVACVMSLAQMIVFIPPLGAQGAALAAPVSTGVGATVGYTIFGAALRVVLAWSLQATSAVAVQFVNALAVPLFSAIALAPVLPQRQIFALLLCALGCLAAATAKRQEDATPEAPKDAKEVSEAAEDAKSEESVVEPPVVAEEKEEEVEPEEPAPPKVEKAQPPAPAPPAKPAPERKMHPAIARAYAAAAQAEAEAVAAARAAEAFKLAEMRAWRARDEAAAEDAARREAEAKEARERALRKTQEAQRSAEEAQESAREAAQALDQVDSTDLLGRMWKPWMVRQAEAMEAAMESSQAASAKARAAEAAARELQD